MIRGVLVVAAGFGLFSAIVCVGAAIFFVASLNHGWNPFDGEEE